MTVGSAKVAHNTCLNAYHSLGLYASLLPEGAERQAQEEGRQRLLKLAAWYARLIGEEQRKEV